MMKAATPLVTLGVGLGVGLEQLSLLTLLSTALIALGTAVSTAAESATGMGLRRLGVQALGLG